MSKGTQTTITHLNKNMKVGINSKTFNPICSFCKNTKIEKAK